LHSVLYPINALTGEPEAVANLRQTGSIARIVRAITPGTPAGITGHSQPDISPDNPLAVQHASRGQF